MKGNPKKWYKKAEDILIERGKVYSDYMDVGAEEYVVFLRGKLFRLQRDLKRSDAIESLKPLNEDTLVDTINYCIILLDKRESENGE